MKKLTYFSIGLTLASLLSTAPIMADDTVLSSTLDTLDNNTAAPIDYAKSTTTTETDTPTTNTSTTATESDTSDTLDTSDALDAEDTLPDIAEEDLPTNYLEPDGFLSNFVDSELDPESENFVGDTASEIGDDIAGDLESAFLDW